MFERSSGVLLPVSALPSPHGIGTFGAAAYAFADFLAAAGQRYWQILPLGPVGFGDSPYSSFSIFAGNPYNIDLDLLVQDGLLTAQEAAAGDSDGDARQVEYGRLYETRGEILRAAWRRGIARDAAALEKFAKEQPWLADYALFMALKREFGMLPWTDWPEPVRLRRPDSLARYREQLAQEISFYSYIQLLFYRQWDALHDYLRAHGIRVIGDLPIYVSADSADVWAEPAYFQLDSARRPVEVAGVPPDYFSADGQLWGNPLYDWERLAADGYGWWIRRMEGARKRYDVVRIDHFRGFESYWSVPCGERTAKNGRWRKGPGLPFIRMLCDWFYGLPMIAEDLGILTPDVKAMLADSGLPGMKVLEFAFSDDARNAYLPHNYTENCVCYIGTHDNSTLTQWFAEAPPAEAESAVRYFGLHAAEGKNWGMIRGGMSSVAALFVAQMQDLLGLGAEARMNTPGTAQGNWCWRMLPDEASPQLAQTLRACTARYNRI